MFHTTALVIVSLLLARGAQEERIVVPFRETPISSALLASLPGTLYNTALIWNLGRTPPIDGAYDISAQKQPGGWAMPPGAAHQILRMTGLLPAQSYRLPVIKRMSHPFVIQLNNGLEQFAAVLGTDRGEPEAFDRLWIDWDRDHAFSDSEAVSGVETAGEFEKVWCFGPIGVPPGPGRPSSVSMRLSYGPMGIGMPDGILVVHQGTARIGAIESADATHKLMLIDSSLDGRYDTWSSGDSLLTDINVDGQFRVLRPGSLTQGPTNGEASVLTEVMQLPNGELYDVEVAPDGSTLTFRQDRSKYAKITGFQEGSDLVLEIRGLPVALTAKDGTVSVPPGPVQIRSAKIGVPDQAGRFFWASISGVPLQVMQVAPGETQPADPGLPFRLEIRCQKFDEGYSIMAVLKDRFERTVSEVLNPRGEDLSQAKITIQDSKGKVLWDKPMRVTEPWTPPRGAAGPFTATATLDLGPLGKLKASTVLDS